LNGSGLRVGVVGLGVMGGGMAVHLAAGGSGGGREVNVFDVRPGAADALSPEGGSLKSWGSAREVAQNSDLVITCVYSPADAEAALLSEDGVIGGLAAGSICIDTTTNTIDVIARAEAACAAKGVRFLASPVTSRPPRMTMMMGGDRSAFDEALPIIADIAANPVYLGTAEAACIAKHVNQYLTYANVLVACEGMAAAAKAGVPLEAMAKVLQGGSGNSFMLGFVLSEVVGWDPPVVPAALRLVAKDVRLSRQSFDAIGVDSTLLATANELYDAAENTLAEEPFPTLYRAVAERYGVVPSPSSE
jgi:3-hydroxyisobutyrate dehydrogenase-like beta-hydroxyacid dehydrogenase